MGLYSGGLIVGRISAFEIWGAYFREGLFLGELIMGILRYLSVPIFRSSPRVASPRNFARACISLALLSTIIAIAKITIASSLSSYNGRQIESRRCMLL